MADIPFTTPKLQPLGLEEAAQTGFTHSVEIEASDINTTTGADGDTITVTIGNTPAEFLVDRAAIYVETAFTTDGTLTVQVGTDGDPDNFIDAQDCKAAGPIIADPGATVKTEAGSIGTAADVLVVRFTTQAATGAPGDISAGKLHCFLRLIDLHYLATSNRS